MRYLLSGLLVVGLLWMPTRAAAQFGAPDDELGARPAASLGATFVSFEYTGAADVEEPILFQGLAPSLTLSVPGLTLIAVRGRSSPVAQSQGTDLTDVQLTLWGRWHPFDAWSEGATQLYVPVGLHTNYRDVSVPLDREGLPTNSFEVTTLAIGGGIGGSQQLGSETLARARAQPFIGIAQRSFLGGADATWLLDADAELVRADVFGSLGLAVGYAVRWQSWRVGQPAFQQNGPRDLHHTGVQHTLRLGLLF